MKTRAENLQDKFSAIPNDYAVQAIRASKKAEERLVRLEDRDRRRTEREAGA